MARFNDAPVTPEKIQLIHDLLSDPIVGEAWKQYTSLTQAQVGSSNTLIKARFKAWHNYVLLRDQFLGLPTTNVHFLNRLEFHK
jgi:hypothetical protein